MKELTLKFDDYKVIRNKNGGLVCFCPCGGKIRNAGKLIKNCTNKCKIRLPKDIDSALDTMGYYLQPSITGSLDNLGELIRKLYTKEAIEQMQTLQAPIFDMLNKHYGSENERPDDIKRPHNKQS